MTKGASFFSFKERSQVYWYNLANAISYILILLSIVFVYPIDLDFLGRIRYVESIGHFLFPILSFGLAQAFVNFTPLLESYHIKTFFGNSILMVLMTTLIAFGLVYAIHLYYPLSNFYLLSMAILMGMGLAYIEIFKSKALFLNKVNLPVYLEKLVPKLALILIFFYIYKETNGNHDALVLAYVLVFILVSILMLVYILHYTAPRFSLSELYFFENFSKSQLIKYSSYSLIGSIGSYLAFRIDGFLIPQYLTMEHNGLYSMASLLAGAIIIPSTGIVALNINSISSLIYKNDFHELGQLYLTSAKKAFYYCSFVFILIWIILPFITSYHALSYSQIPHFEYTVLVLGVGMLINISTGFNTEIITYSKYIKYNIIFIVLLSVFNVVLTIWFLRYTSWGILGVAISTSISLILYNVLKLVFIKIKFNLWPFDSRYFLMIFCIVLLGLVLAVCPRVHSPLITAAIKLSMTLLLYYAIKLYIIDGKKLKEDIEYY